MPETKTAETPKRKPVRNFFKSFVDVKRWSSYDEVSTNAKTVWGLFRRLTKRTQEIRQETYEEAVACLGLTPEQIILRKKNFLYAALIYWTFALGFLIYFIYLLIHLNLLASFLTFILVIVMSLTAYREHFWYMQMQKKKLGCRFHDWITFILKKEVGVK
ncbi:MAG: type IVB secretion system protein IcmV [Coxiellaceae bacterium]|jgi:hypothetical protein|nr:type IVB secretion system protein IcmV [Coxiellaceae bacterium]